MSPALGAIRRAVAVTPINTGVFQSAFNLAGLEVRSWRVEIDGATGTFYSGTGFTPIAPDVLADYISSMGFLLSIFILFTNVAPGAAGAEVRIDEGISGGGGWRNVRNDLITQFGAVPFKQRGIPVAGSFARVSLVNNENIVKAVEVSIKAMTQ